MKNIAIICGGRSAEHEVSIMSAKNIAVSIDKEKYNPIIIIVSRTGIWYLVEYEIFLNDDITECFEPFDHGVLCSLMRQVNQTILFTTSKQIVNIDVAFPIIHGPMGEDGSLQGYLEMMSIPYTGSGVLASAICMDKVVMRNVLKDAGLPTIPYLAFSKIEDIPSYTQAQKQLGSEILFIKPTVMGSSVGVYKVKSEAEYHIATRQAFKYSMKIMIDKFIPCIELECSVLGNEEPEVSSVGSIIPNHEFYSYEAKYIDPNGAEYAIPAEISEDISDKIRQIAKDGFKAVGCSGFSRIDFFLSKEDGQIYLNELNTIPGFTNISMYPKLWLYDGLNYSDLISKIIDLAIELFDRKKQIHLVPEFLDNHNLSLSHSS